jgi:hypothetical protein
MRFSGPLIIELVSVEAKIRSKARLLRLLAAAGDGPGARRRA